MRTSLLIDNMQCAHCVSTINKSLLKINGIYGVEADVANQSLQIEHTDEVSLSEIATQLKDLGYPQKSVVEDSFADKAAEWDMNPIRQNQAEKFFKRVVEIVPINPKAKLIDFGAGTGLVGLRFAPYVKHLTMLDNSLAMLGVLQNKIKSLELEADKFDLVSTGIDSIQNKHFDILVSLMTFHHLEDVPGTIKSIHHKLVEGGYIAVADLVSEDGSFHDEKVPHNGFEPKEICSYLNDAGFKLILCETYNQITKPTQQGMKSFDQFLIIAKK